METTLYDDNSRQSVKKMKLGMSLDLKATEQQKKTTMVKQARLDDLTTATPDLGLFMLASPDLERFIIQQNGMVLTTPTPTTQILFPKTVTEEQEAYARGFVDALGELHKNYGTPLIGSTATGTVASVRGAVVPQKQVVVQKVQGLTNFASTTTTMLPGSIFAVSTAPGMNLSQTAKINSQMLVQPKVEVGGPPQTVPTFRGSVAQSSAVAVSPINMDDQEAAKLDRKRARNRLAATRCRNRKLERISRLEERVKELKGQNSRLGETAAALREQVLRLKQNIIEHTQSGCRVMLSHNLL